MLFEIILPIVGLKKSPFTVFCPRNCGTATKFVTTFLVSCRNWNALFSKSAQCSAGRPDPLQTPCIKDGFTNLLKELHLGDV
jgi:hypothetical protein